jgi:hypothetical protein
MNPFALRQAQGTDGAIGHQHGGAR